MDDGGQRESRRQRAEHCKGGHTPWNGIPHYQIREQNMYSMNSKISMLVAERDAAIEERDRALAEKRAAIDERDRVIQQRDVAISERDNAFRERDNAIAALQFQESAISGALGCGIDRDMKHLSHHRNPHGNYSESPSKSMELHITEAIPLTAISSEAVRSHISKQRKVRNVVPAKPTKSAKKSKKVGEDLNRHITTDGSKAEWEAQDLSCIKQIDFDETKMPTPVCTCTGVARQCYKWGNGGWQSSCCTTSISVYPLPQIPNKRHARMGGRKMSGSVFGRLLTRIASAGHDLSIPVDLKNYWAKHGTNRYITIK